MKRVKIGVVGLGPTRGKGLVWLLTQLNHVDIVAVCDVYADRVDDICTYLQSESKSTPEKFTDYVDMIEKCKMDALIISTSWAHHVDIAEKAMIQGVIVGMEVGGAYSEEDCWRLIRTYEQTKTPFMFLENCCYDKPELLGTSLVRAGILGKVVACSGEYSHDLRDEIITGKEKRHYRLDNYILRNCENYPTHELGPIMKLLNINRGNRLVSLTSLANKPIGLKEYVKKIKREEFYDVEFAQSDVVYTTIQCAGGEIISIKLCTTVPRYYDRAFVVQGTNGLFSQPLHSVFLDGDKHVDNSFETAKNILGNAKEYESEYLPEIWKNITKEEQELGHGGCDYLMMKEFIRCVRDGEEMPIDVYDAAAMMCISYLSEQSILHGGAPQAIPDFTRGKWITRPAKDVVKMPHSK